MSGRISYSEFVALSREEQYLNLLPHDVSDDQLKAFWLAMDVDRSGFLTRGEFGAFRRRALRS